MKEMEEQVSSLEIYINSIQTLLEILLVIK